MAGGGNKIICLTIESSLFHLPTAINLLKFPPSFVWQLSSCLCYWFPYVLPLDWKSTCIRLNFFFFPCCRENDVVLVLIYCSFSPHDIIYFQMSFWSRCQWFSPVWNWHLSFPHTKRSVRWKVSVYKTQVIFHVLGICCPIPFLKITT